MRRTVAEPVTRYDPDDEAPTRPGCEPLELYAPGASNDVTRELVTRRELLRLCVLTALLSSAAIVGFDVAELWQLGGYDGLVVAAMQNGAGVVLGMAVVTVMGWRNR